MTCPDLAKVGDLTLELGVPKSSIGGKRRPDHNLDIEKTKTCDLQMASKSGCIFGSVCTSRSDCISGSVYVLSDPTAASAGGQQTGLDSTVGLDSNLL